MAEDSDDVLLARWREGNDEAGATLARRHFKSVVGFFRYRTDHGVDDLVQRTFLACVEARDRVPEGVSIRAYLLGIAHKLWLNTMRKAHREKRAMGVEANAPPPSMRSPSGAMAMREEQRLLLQALRSLPDDLQTTIELHYWERLKLQEIAVVMSVPLGTVKSRLARARSELKRVVEELDAGSLGRTTVDELDRWARSLAGLTREE